MHTTTHPQFELDEGTGQGWSVGSLPDWFSQVCLRFGDRPAVTHAGISTTYAELHRAAEHVAAELARRGAGPGTFVAICMERSVEMIAAMIGVAKCGAAYLPLDPGYPAARLRETLADAAPVVLLTTRTLATTLQPTDIVCVCIDELATDGPRTDASAHIAPDDAAYVIYTSGSTGRPKGVVVTHRNVLRLLTETAPWFHFDQNDVWTMFHSFAFDFSVWEIWGCLLHGGRLVIVPFAVSRSPEEFHALLASEKVTVLNQTPSAFALLDQVDGRPTAASLSLRLVIFGGEALFPAALRGWMDRHGDALPQMVNMYGITETTVHVTYRRMRRMDAASEHETLIGEPIPDLHIYLLNDQLLPVDAGEEGEICIGGPGVARGYLNRPALTNERFCASPFSLDGARLYRSGDLGRRRNDGELVYLGRRDGQVKINGFRIEVGEIETALLAHVAIMQCCVVATSEVGAPSRLAAYYIAQQGHEPTTAELRSVLAAHLPTHMMPAFYQRLAIFPLTPNGKIDRKALPAPTAGSTLTDRTVPGMATTHEDLVANIWRVVLKADHVSFDDNFFDVGGTSLLLIAVRTGLQEQLSRQIPVTWMFECTTIRALAARLRAGSEPEPSAADGHAKDAQEKARRQRIAFARARNARGVAQ